MSTVDFGKERKKVSKNSFPKYSGLFMLACITKYRQRCKKKGKQFGLSKIVDWIMAKINSPHVPQVFHRLRLSWWGGSEPLVWILVERKSTKKYLWMLLLFCIRKKHYPTTSLIEARFRSWAILQSLIRGVCLKQNSTKTCLYSQQKRTMAKNNTWGNY